MKGTSRLEQTRKDSCPWPFYPEISNFQVIHDDSCIFSNFWLFSYISKRLQQLLVSIWLDSAFNKTFAKVYFTWTKSCSRGNSFKLHRYVILKITENIDQECLELEKNIQFYCWSLEPVRTLDFQYHWHCLQLTYLTSPQSRAKNTRVNK